MTSGYPRVGNVYACTSRNGTECSAQERAAHATAASADEEPSTPTTTGRPLMISK
jgi:hypothetical protein